MPEKDLIVVETENTIQVEFNRPDTVNDITPDMWDQLYRLLSQPRNKLLILRGRNNTFSKGRAPVGKPHNEEEAHHFLDVVGQVNEALFKWPLPTIAVVEGEAHGAALGLILHCDIAVAAYDAQFSFPEILHGIAPTIVAAYLGDRLGYRRAADLLLTGRVLSSTEAYEIGVVQYVAEAGRLEDITQNLVGGLTTKDFEALAYTKRGLQELPHEPFEQRLRLGIDRVVKWQLRNKQ